MREATKSLGALFFFFWGGGGGESWQEGISRPRGSLSVMFLHGVTLLKVNVS